jgi:hypothetical protein
MMQPTVAADALILWFSIKYDLAIIDCPLPIDRYFCLGSGHDRHFSEFIAAELLLRGPD